MKKVIAIGVTAMLVLAVALAAYGQTSTTEVTFEVSDSYVLYIPPTVSIGSNGTGSMNIYLMEGRIDSVCVSLNINDNFETTWQLKGTKGYMLPYQIFGASGETIMPDDNFSVFKNGGLTLTLSVLPSYLSTAPADIYKDTLSFTFK